MHVGHANKNCPNLKVHEKEMIQVNEVKYLGETITHTAADSVEETINKRKGNAMLTINEIATMINNTK